MLPVITIASYVLASVATVLVLHYHLLPAVLAGLAMHILTGKLARRLPATWHQVAQKVALVAIVVLVAVLLSGAGIGLWAFLKDSGLVSLFDSAAGSLDRLRQILPPDLAKAIPASVEEFRKHGADLMREYGGKLSAFGLEGVKIFVQVLIGAVIGGMLSLHHFKEQEERLPLSNVLYQRMAGLRSTFEKIIIAQVFISLFNTVLTALYLLVLLPICGVSLPFRTILLVVTFLCGLLPIIGNLMSNSLIILISLGVSFEVGVAAFIFLVGIHKLEYFVNAKLCGSKVHASAWELLCSILLMEAIFGIEGIVAAPIVYAWIKSEAKALALV